MEGLERRFHLKERGTGVRTEALEGATTFMTMAYILTVIEGHLDDLRHARPVLKKRRVSLFVKARHLFQEVCDRKPLSVVTRFFQHLFEFLGHLLSQKTLDNPSAIFLTFSKQQGALLQ